MVLKQNVNVFIEIEFVYMQYNGNFAHLHTVNVKKRRTFKVENITCKKLIQIFAYNINV